LTAAAGGGGGWAPLAEPQQGRKERVAAFLGVSGFASATAALLG